MMGGALLGTERSGLLTLHSGPNHDLEESIRRNRRKKCKKTQKKMKGTAINDINELCDFVRETAFAIHRYHRLGLNPF